MHLHYLRLTGGIVDSDATYLTSHGGSILILGDPKLHVGEECGKDKGIPPTLVNATGVHFLGCKGADWESRMMKVNIQGTCIVHAEIGALTQGGLLPPWWLQQRRGVKENVPSIHTRGNHCLHPQYS